jgi:hypothetical protein
MNCSRKFSKENEKLVVVALAREMSDLKAKQPISETLVVKLAKQTRRSINKNQNDALMWCESWI